MKTFLSFCFIVAFVAIAQVESAVINAYIESYTELYRENVIRPAEPHNAQAVEVNYSGKGLIIDININDHIENRNGATPKLVKGGPGSKNVTILLEGKRGYGINSTVVIYGEV